MTDAHEHPAMTEGRGLLTESERDAIAGETSDSYRYKTRSFLRNRIEKVADDIDVLAEHDPDLLEELRGVVCKEGNDE
jgi:DNA polymerase II small subunit/DNA polymerase delta subunit B